MWKQLWATWIGLGAIALAGCEALPLGSAPAPAPVETNESAPVPIAAKPQAPTAPTPVIDGAATFQKALDLGYGAAKLTQSAYIPADWQYVMSRWQEAIVVLQSVPPQSAQHAQAQAKIQEYRSNLAYARERSRQPIAQPPATIAAQPLSAPASNTTPDSNGGTQPGAAATPIPASSPSGNPDTSSNLPAPETGSDSPNSTAASSGPVIATIPIIRRVSGIPVIEVTFNGRKFPMMLDTGASATVITSKMLSTLGIRPHDKILVSTPSDRRVTMDLARVDTVQVEGLSVSNLEVGVAPALEIGLLGQNFFGGYDLIIRGNQIEFHSRG